MWASGHMAGVGGVAGRVVNAKQETGRGADVGVWCFHWSNFLPLRKNRNLRDTRLALTLHGLEHPSSLPWAVDLMGPPVSYRQPFFSMSPLGRSPRGKWAGMGASVSVVKHLDLPVGISQCWGHPTFAHWRFSVHSLHFFPLGKSGVEKRCGRR